MHDNTSQLAQFQREFTAYLLMNRNEPPLLMAQQKALHNTELGLAVYRNNVLYSLTQALADQYPIVQRLVGTGFFARLALDYVRTYPPIEPSLTFYGDHLAGFIATRTDCDRVPYLADMARLELACQQALHARDDRPLQATVLLALPPEQLPESTLPLLAAATLLQSQWPLQRIHAENLKDEPALIELDQADTTQLLIYRHHNEVQIVALQPCAFTLLQQLQQGHALQEAWQHTQQHLNVSDDEMIPLLVYLLKLDVFAASTGEHQ